ncbi:MAG: PKD domain-containing protein, partial [Nocardioidaceae bacterium]
LWFNDGLWWATMFDPASLTWHIFRLDRATEKWEDTGTQVDNRPQTLSDALWDGQKLYIASQWVTISSTAAPKASVVKPARLYRYSYLPASKTYVLDTGFPATINNNSSETLNIDKDSTGRLWATWTQVSGSSTTGFTNTVYVNSTVGSDNNWGTPMVLPVAGANPDVDDISAVVAFGSNRIGVMWSNQLDGTVYWAVHPDGAPTTTWTGSVAVRGNKLADDHINIKTLQADQAGRVFAAVKTSLDEAGAPSTSAQINLLTFKPGTGSWSSATFGTIADCHTRPIVMLDEENSQVHMFATGPTASGCAFSGAPGTIYEKVASLDNPVFPPGRGTPVIRDIASENMNNATSTKQSVNSRTGLVVLASNNTTTTYWHADLPVAGAPVPAPTASFTASPTSGVAPLQVSFTDNSTGSPTSRAWTFGNGVTSTAQNPTTTYTAAGTYTVTLTASNAGGSSTTTKTITVSAPPSHGILRQTESTKVDTTADTHLTITKPAGTSSGDLLVSCFSLNGSTVKSAPSGWTAMAAVTNVARPRVYGYYRIAGASEPASYRWNTNASVASSGGIVRYSGASGLDAPAVKASGLSGTTATVPGVTTVTSNAMVVGCMGVGLSATPVQITGPTSMSQVWDLAGTQNEFDDAGQATPGPTGTRTWTFTHARDWAGWLAALRPR